MNFEMDKKYYGFKLIEEKTVKEINSTSRIFYHEKSGTRLLHLENEDDNKVFSINFRTPPASDNGLPHIMEHSVLAGSRKYPVRDPFAELLKGSLNTFLNAGTYPDKTLYYFASKNEKDFMNLMNVYMDAVLYPNIYIKPETLMQEGWHYELFDKDGELTYNGIVYNEMKGAMSSPDDLLYSKSLASLFPDTAYRFESGGIPEEIPSLTYDEFLDFHRRYYHPSNSYIFIYGNGNILNQLEFLDKEYLDNFECINIDSHISLQKPFDELKEIVVEYPIGMDEEEEDKASFSLNFAAGTATDPVLSLSFEILQNILLDTPASPLKNALIQADLGSDAFGDYIDYTLQPVFRIILKDSDADRKAEFKAIVFNTLKDLVNTGIDKKLIEASINSKEFNMREADYGTIPKGIMYCEKVLNSWIYDSDPTLHLEYDAALAKIREFLNIDYFEKLIEKYLLNNTHCSLVVLRPSNGLSERRSEETAQRLKAYKATLSEGEIQNLIDETLRLKELQDTPDSEDALRTIPLLSKEDISNTAEVLPLIEKEELGVKLLYHPVFTSKIAYINLYFDTKGVKEELIPYITLLCSILGEAGTNQRDYSDLSKEIHINTGGITFETDAYDSINDNNQFNPKLIVKSKALTSNVPILVKLIEEIINSTDLADKRRLGELISQTKSRMEMILLDNGHLISALRLSSYFSPSGRYRELTNGISFYKFVDDLDRNFDTKSGDIIVKLQKVCEAIFNKNNLMISVTVSEEDYNAVTRELSPLIVSLPTNRVSLSEYDFNFAPDNEGLLTSSEVQYVAKGFSFTKLGYSYHGSLRVLNTIISLNYLWEKVRIQGGAYGGFARIDRSGNMVFLSYRDPNLSETLEVYDNIPEYVRNFKASDRELTKFIIGTISQLDTPLTPALKGEVSTINYIRGLTQEDIQRERDEILNTKESDINALYDLVLAVISQNHHCALGNEDKIKECAKQFHRLVTVFE